MFKKNFLFTVLLIGTLSINAQVKTPDLSPHSKTTQTVGLTEFSVKYSRPSLRDRVIFGDLVPFGKTWRTGANENTTISFDDDITINGQTLKKGTYALYTIPNKDSWEVIFYSDAKNWGKPREWDESKIALKTIVKPIDIGTKIETFTITFDDLKSDSTVLGLLWESTYVGIKIEVPTDKKAEESIKKALSGPKANDYFKAASYFRKSGKNLPQALKWIAKAIELNPDAYWMMREKAFIYVALGDKKSAIEVAKKSMLKADEKGDKDYFAMNKKSIAEWSK
jgi:hypothetical protein